MNKSIIDMETNHLVIILYMKLSCSPNGSPTPHYYSYGCKIIMIWIVPEHTTSLPFSISLYTMITHLQYLTVISSHKRSKHWFGLEMHSPYPAYQPGHPCPTALSHKPHSQILMHRPVRFVHPARSYYTRNVFTTDASNTT